MLFARPQATDGDFVWAVVTGVIFLAWAVFIYRSGWTSTAMMRRMRRPDHQPERAGFVWWSTWITSGLFGAVGVIGGIVQLLR